MPIGGRNHGPVASKRGQSAAVGDQHRHSGAESIEDREAERLLPAGGRQHDGRFQAQLAKLILGQKPREAHRVVGQGPQARLVGPGPGDHERHAGRARRGDRRVEALLLDEPSGGQRELAVCCARI